MSMIERMVNPRGLQIDEFLARPSLSDSDSLERSVADVVREVATEGDSALFACARQFDHANLASLVVSQEELEAASMLISFTLRDAMARAMANIVKFHTAQMPVDERVETEPGVFCWRRSVPIDTVGLYAPGGSAPLFSTVLMLAIPARIAGCRRIVLATPPRADGTVHPAILHAASISGVSLIVKSGGAQAIAALAYGTETVPRADKIFGPGNRFVTRAKQMVALNRCAIDMPAGPSEVMVAIDKTSDPAFAAADMLSQAEHGPDSQAVLVVLAEDGETGNAIVDAVERELTIQLKTLSRQDILSASLAHCKAVVVTDRDRMVEVINAYGPEHLILGLSDYVSVEHRIVNAGSVFLGQWSCESVGDYASGTNHTLPTAGWAKAYGGVSLDSYFKKITFQRLTRAGLRSLGPVIETLAGAESLDAHARAVAVRLASGARESL